MSKDNGSDSKSSAVFDKMKMMQIEKKDKEEKVNDITTLKGFLMEYIKRLQDADISGFSAQLAYFFLLSFFPLLIFLVTLLPFLNIDQDQVYLFLNAILPEQVYSLINGTISEVLQNRNGGLLSIGVIGTIWSASKGVDALIKSLNRSYDKDETRPFIIARLVSVIFTFLLVGLIIIALLLSVFGKQIGTVLFSYFGLAVDFFNLWNNIRWIMPPLLIFIVLTVMYWIGPNIKLYLRSVLLGSAAATIAWIVLSYGFSYYVSNFANYSATYGSIGGIIILMLWLYFTGMILMAGGQINAIMQQRREVLEARKRG
ncbi:YihY/virulence factor BrkB family protein [Viridibacillus sp. YIM B01967]|uniref:YihY/virulence factor BrkB family protein n=1 Tax=Viridibacillus soli TaxID=2798301 RepID=A0ABS1H913_9BACL|nr:YihY/virulence factor BrkB family protein [Viridibacillus soli]MBK3495794.1 YihY/virulence factor BrkB family protein [Viridibacillus soli]